VYNVTIDVHSTTEQFNESVYRVWGLNMIESNTSDFNPEEVPLDAWDSFPRNRIFQNQSGYEIDGNVLEDWLTNNPYTIERPDEIHYRFYMMNLANLTPQVADNSIVVVTFLVAGVGIVIVVLIVIQKKVR
jgi:hypothetical protein